MSAPSEKFMPEKEMKGRAVPWLEHAPFDAAPDWVRALRETAVEIFAGTGLPNPKDEGWQYTNLRDLKPEKFAFAVAPAVFDAKKLPEPLLQNSYRAVLVNGQFQPSLSDLPEQAQVMSFLEAAEKTPDISEYLVHAGELADQPFLALNAAHARDGIVIRLGKSRELDRPIEVLFYTQDGVLSCPRVLYWLGENSGMTIIENHVGQGAYLSIPHAEMVAQADARLKLYRFVDEDAGASHVGSTTLSAMKNAQFEGFSGSFGGKLVRQTLRMRLLDSAIYSSIGGIYLKEGQQTQDFTVLADHFEEGGTSAQHFKGVIDDKARAVFQGKIHVRRSAQKTDGYQSHHALLLSDQAEASAKPELEIYADDVKCSHGATSGQLDEAALFYLRSRGIPRDEAYKLLIESFLAEGVEKISNTGVRGLFMARVIDWLERKEKTA